MHAKFCPNCGHRVLPNAKFCGNCGYQFKAKDQNVGRPDANNSRLNHTHYQRRIPLGKVPQGSYQPHHYLRTVIVAIIVLLIGAGGYKVYQHVTEPTNVATTKSNGNRQAIPKATVQDKLNDVWGCAQDEVNDGDDSNTDNEPMSDYFTSNTDKNGYHDLYNWAKDMHKDDSIDGIDMSTGVKSITPVANNLARVKYLVKYTFHNEGDNTHYQGFIWNAKFKKANGTWLICYNRADNDPVYNHD